MVKEGFKLELWVGGCGLRGHERETRITQVWKMNPRKVLRALDRSREEEAHSMPTAPQTRKSLCVLTASTSHAPDRKRAQYLMPETGNSRRKEREPDEPPVTMRFSGGGRSKLSLQYGTSLPRKEDHGRECVGWLGWTRCEDPACFKQRG